MKLRNALSKYLLDRGQLRVGGRLGLGIQHVNSLPFDEGFSQLLQGATIHVCVGSCLSVYRSRINQTSRLLFSKSCPQQHPSKYSPMGFGPAVLANHPSGSSLNACFDGVP